MHSKQDTKHTFEWQLSETTCNLHERKRSRKHQIEASVSNPLTWVIKDTLGLLCEALSTNLKHLNSKLLLPDFGFRALGSASNVLATRRDPTITPN